MAAIQLLGVGKRFGDFIALRDFNLEIRDREFMALLGPSGCGKSTTMNMLAGLEAPTTGTIRFDDRDMAGVPMGRRGVGFVFQNYAIFTHLNVRENLAYGLRARGLPAAQVRERSEEIAAFLELTPLLDAPTSGLSVNILQRVAIGRSAAVRPEIFLLDEPLSNVDAAFRAVMRTELRHLQRELKQTMVYVTHDQLEAMTMADRIAVMDHGVLQQVGTPLDVYNHPANTFVARFLGSPNMNLLPVILLENDGALLARFADGSTLTCPVAWHAAMSGRARDAMLLGVRPEHLRLTAPGTANAFGGRIEVIERIGARTIVHVRCTSQVVKVVDDSDCAVTEGDAVGLLAPACALRLFDGVSGCAIGDQLALTANAPPLAGVADGAN